MKQPGKIVVWVANIDRNKTKRQGRRIPKSTSVDSPRLAEVEAAAESLSLRFTSKPGVPRPRTWWEKTGYLLVEKGDLNRSDLLRTIARQVAKERPIKKS